MAVFGEVTFVRVTAQIYTGEVVVPSKNDIFVKTYDMSGFADGTIINVTQLDEYAAREMTIECSNNIEPGTATINIIDPSGQFSVSGTFEIISNVLVNITALKRFKEKIETELENNSGGNVTIESYTSTYDFSSSGSSLTSNAYKTGSVTLSEVTTQPRIISIRTSRLYTIMTYTYSKLDNKGLTINFNYLTSTGGSATIYIDLIY